MDARDHGPKDVPTPERMKRLGQATGNAVTHKLHGEHETAHGASRTVDRSEVESVIVGWPEAPKTMAEQMMERYGSPNEMTPTKLFWYNNSPWKRTLLTSDIVTHNFPSPHSDFLTQYIDYNVPIDKFDDLANFDGSCIVDRTAGEVAARCDSEWANTLTMNLMHDIVTGKTYAEEAKKTYADQAAAYTMGRSAPYAEEFQFEVPRGGTEDPDESMMAGSMIKETVGKVKDVLTGS